MPQTSLEIPADHPAFAGHFPGQPIVPGVVLLDTAQRIIETENPIRLIGLAVAKFHSPAAPGAALVLDYAINNGRVRFAIHCGSRKIADGQFLLQAESSPS